MKHPNFPSALLLWYVVSGLVASAWRPSCVPRPFLTLPFYNSIFIFASLIPLGTNVRLIKLDTVISMAEIFLEDL